MSSPSRRGDAVAIWKAGVAAVHGARVVERVLRVRGRTVLVKGAAYDLPPGGRLLVVGAGKAGPAMVRGVERVLRKTPLASSVEGWVNVVGAGHNSRFVHLHSARKSRANEPTAAAVRGTRRLRRQLESVGKQDLVLCLLSGGASSLLVEPAAGLTLTEKRTMTRLLLKAGASISEMNTVRKHLSAIKGGGLAQATRARIVSLILSDVIGDDPGVIASGPTAADPTTYAHALEVLDRHLLVERTPPAVLVHLGKGAAGKLPETLKRTPGRVKNLVIGSSADAVIAAVKEAKSRGYRVLNLSTFWEGEAREVGKVLAGLGRGIRDRGEPVRPPACVISAGETTVSLGARAGKGGRNQELALAAWVHLEDEALRDLTLMSAGTDGEDGPTDAAGAVVNPAAVRRGARLGLSARVALDAHDAYPFLEETGALFRSGPTGTNVMDLQVLLVG